MNRGSISCGIGSTRGTGICVCEGHALVKKPRDIAGGGGRDLQQNACQLRRLNWQGYTYSAVTRALCFESVSVVLPYTR